MYSIQSNDTKFDIEKNKDSITVNNENLQVQFVKNKNDYTIVIGGKNYTAQLVKVDKENKQITWRINHTKYVTTIKEAIDLLLEKLGMNIVHTKKINSLKAPMPGLIVKIMSKAGDEIKKGEPLLVLEAMKMENVFKAHEDVRVKKINVSEKEAVEKNQILIEFE